jgi:uncharacterized membrane protein YedE/YeeE
MIRWSWIAAVVIGAVVGMAFALLLGEMGENALVAAWREPWI